MKGEFGESDAGDDELYDDAVKIVLEMGKASTSVLQRRLRIGYGRAASLLDAMERGAVAMLINAMEPVDRGGASQEKAVLAPGAAAIRSTRVVDFHTGKTLREVTKCHLNAAVFDSDWERQAAEILGAHPVVEAWVKNDRLGLVIPYRKEGVARKYLPDFLGADWSNL